MFSNQKNRMNISLEEKLYRQKKIHEKLVIKFQMIDPHIIF